MGPAIARRQAGLAALLLALAGCAGREAPPASVASATASAEAPATPAAAATAAAASAVPGGATVRGPVSGGARGHAFLAIGPALAKHGYVEEEFFLEGRAATYRPASGPALPADGRWVVKTGGGERYKTRILVRRPSDRARFNGTVIVEWFQPSAGFDKDVNWMWKQETILREGFAWVGVSAQRESVNGARPFEDLGIPDLVHWDPQRYRGLSIPSEDLSYDIFAQAGQAVGPDRPQPSAAGNTEGGDPMGGLKVERLVAVGNTFAAARLFPYYNAVQPLKPVYHGFVIGWRHIPGGHALAKGVQMPEAMRLRSDVSAPVIVLNSTAEALAYYPARQPDSATFRLWEVAGAAHTNAYWAPQMYERMRREFGRAVPACDRPFNAVPTQHVFGAAILRMHEWLKTGKAPGPLPPLTIGGTPPRILPDRHGNAGGGLRLPAVEVPTARYETGGDPACPGAPGFSNPLPPAQLMMMYPTHAAYVEKVKQAAAAAVKAGYLLPPDAAATIAEAEAAPVPK